LDATALRTALVPYTTLFRSPARRKASVAARAGITALRDANKTATVALIFMPLFQGSSSTSFSNEGMRARSSSRIFSAWDTKAFRSEEHTSELQSLRHLVCRL